MTDFATTYASDAIPSPIALPRRSGSTVHAGGYWCEAYDCFTARKTRQPGARVARWTEWRLRGKRARATWVLCDECLFEAKGAVIDDGEHSLYLPLLHPSDPYARIAVEELLYSIAAFGAACAARVRVDSHPRCGWDVYGFGGRNPKKPCRARATQVVEDWLEVDGGDLYLCDRHAKTLKRRERGEIETERVLDFGGGV
jgi:hypothetical protein